MIPRILRSSNLSSLWEQSIEQLLENGQVVPSERGGLCLELCNVILVCTNPFKEPRVSRKFPLNSDIIGDQVKEMLEGLENIPSVYDRIHAWNEKEIDQEYIITKMLENRWYTRRAVISLLDPQVDFFGSDPPGCCLLHFVIRKAKLHMNAFFRSNDAWNIALPNMVAFTEFQKRVADSLGVDVGNYVHIASSYHIYYVDVPAVKRLFRGKGVE